MIITLVGIILTIPNALTLLIFVLGFVLIQIQVRLEEEFLIKLHGAEYEIFRSQVSRWLWRTFRHFNLNKRQNDFKSCQPIVRNK